MKKSFTLLEVLISITISMFIFLAVFQIINSLKTSKAVFEKKISNKEGMLVKTLYYDILNAKKIAIVKSPNPKFIRLFLITSNSLYGFQRPYVVWVAEKNGLVRIEDKDVINLPGSYTHLDRFLKNVKIFKIYKNKSKYFVFIKSKKNIYFEFEGR
jgi:type II secretory pathway component PulJ